MKKEQIIEAARALFTMYGYRKVSMDEIAREAGVTKKTIYTYFKDKDELYQYFVLEEIEQMKKIIEKNEKKPIPFAEKIHQTIYEVLTYKKQAKLIEGMVREAPYLGNITQSLQYIDDNIQQYLKRKIETAIQEGHIRKCDTDLAAFLLFRMYTAVMYEYPKKQKNIDKKAISDKILMFLKEGIVVEEGGKTSE